MVSPRRRNGRRDFSILANQRGFVWLKAKPAFKLRGLGGFFRKSTQAAFGFETIRRD
jgi:hypothetical protein